MVDKKDNCGHTSKFIILHGQKTKIDDDRVPIIKEFRKLDIRATQCYQGDDASIAKITFDVNTIAKIEVT